MLKLTLRWLGEKLTFILKTYVFANIVKLHVLKSTRRRDFGRAGNRQSGR